MTTQPKSEISGNIATHCQACGQKIEITHVVCGECKKLDKPIVQNMCQADENAGQTADADQRSIQQVIDDAAMRVSREILNAGDFASHRYDGAKKKIEMLDRTINILNDRVRMQKEKIAKLKADLKSRGESEAERVLREWGQAIEASFVADISEDLDEEERVEIAVAEYTAQGHARSLARRIAIKWFEENFGGTEDKT